MINSAPNSEKLRTAYLLAWLTYMLFTLCAFPVFSITVMLFSIILSMIGAWLYYYPGCLFTTALTIPYHYLMLRYFSDDPTTWNEAFNPFGISTQLLISGSIALIQSARNKLNILKTQLEKRVELRTQELNQLNNYIIENYEKQQTLLSRTLLQNIGSSLCNMDKESTTLGSRLVAENNPNTFRAVRLNQLIKKIITYVNDLNFIDYSQEDEQVKFACLVQKLANNFEETAGTHFELIICGDLEELPETTQYQLYRITHEAVTNAVRHGKAKQIEIALKTNNIPWILTVVNDGNPLPEKLEEGSGTSMVRQRAEIINATVNIGTTYDGLTRFECVSNQNTVAG